MNHALGHRIQSLAPLGPYDIPQRQAADELDRAERDWHVYYGVGTHKFWAIGLRPTREPVTISARDIRDLWHAMRTAEMGAAR